MIIIGKPTNTRMRIMTFFHRRKSSPPVNHHSQRD
jgi:hypothetical protein